jgi:hypothetical protein
MTRFGSIFQKTVQLTMTTNRLFYLGSFFCQSTPHGVQCSKAIGAAKVTTFRNAYPLLFHPNLAFFCWLVLYLFTQTAAFLFVTVWFSTCVLAPVCYVWVNLGWILPTEDSIPFSRCVTSCLQIVHSVALWHPFFGTSAVSVPLFGYMCLSLKITL